MTDREAIVQALTVLKAWDALIKYQYGGSSEAMTAMQNVAWRTFDTIEGLEAALAQLEQEPVAYVGEVSEGAELMLDKPNGWEAIPLYTAPPKREWVGLTDNEIAESAEHMEAVDPTDSFWREFSQEIEAKLKEKNT